MFSHETKIRVRYGETDQMGYMYYGNYAEFYEVARVESLRSLGMTYRSMEEDGVMMPVLEMHAKYLKPALYDEEIKIRTIIEKMPGVRIHFKYLFYNEKEELIHEAETTLVFIDMKKNRPCLPPIGFTIKMQAFFE